MVWKSNLNNSSKTLSLLLSLFSTPYNNLIIVTRERRRDVVEEKEACMGCFVFTPKLFYERCWLQDIYILNFGLTWWEYHLKNFKLSTQKECTVLEEVKLFESQNILPSVCSPPSYTHQIIIKKNFLGVAPKYWLEV